MKKYITVKDDHGYNIQVEVKKPKSKVNSEASIQKQIAEVFTRNGFEVIRYNSGTMQGDGRYVIFNTNLTTGMTSGHSDLIAFKNLQAIRIEVKTGTGKLSANQIKYAENGLKRGNPIVVLRSKEEAVLLINSINTFGLESAVYSWIKKIICKK